MIRCSPRAIAASRPAPIAAWVVLFATALALAALIAIAAAPARAGDTDKAEKAAKAPTPIEPAEPKSIKGFVPHEVDSNLVHDLREGGYIIFFRHATTNWNERDVTQGDFANRMQQRNLTEAGQAEAAMIGQSLVALQIPIEKVLASPM